jgi:NAD(P)-dependent dehydrogenase (short-subunit alcohol dehydrogenase family)
LVLVARDPGRAEQTVREIADKTGNRNVEAMLADLSSLDQVHRLAAEFLATGRPLHILLNNAGVVMLRREETVDGFETTFAVNHLSYFLLTNLLLERIRTSAPARIVNVASDAHVYSGGPLDFDDLQSSKGYASMKVYGKSKLANILFTRELGRRLEGSGVTANCLHPGFVGSNLARNNGIVGNLAMLLARPFARSTGKGAETAVYLCTSPDVDGVSGKYFFDKMEKWPKSYAQNDDDARRLWEISAQMTGLAP